MARIGLLRLDQGITAQLLELRQELTYEGLLEGLPTLETNQWKMDYLVEERRDKPYPDGPVHLIEPEQRLIEYTEIKGEEYPFGTPARLPAVTCIGRFGAYEGRRDKRSGLVVIWFQDDYAFPIDPTVKAQLAAIDWERLAEDLGGIGDQ